MAAQDSAWVVHRAANDRRLSTAARNLWQARELVAFFAVRDVRLRYRQAALGVLWVIAQPIAMVLVFSAIFSGGVGVDTGNVPYPLFALVGLLSWTYFATAVTRGSESLVSDADLVTKVSFPRLAVPSAALIPALLDLAVGLSLFLGLCAVYQQPLGWHLALVPVWLLVMGAFCLGLNLWLSALNVRYRDVRNAIGPALQVLLFASPVAYPSTLIEGSWRLAYEINPLTGIIELGRFAFLGTEWPGRQLIIAVVWAVGALVLGFRYFQKVERTLADVI
jgi:ABC-2 type transport system permease protein/lipopolysaccharide transport system permease protein